MFRVSFKHRGPALPDSVAGWLRRESPLPRPFGRATTLDLLTFSLRYSLIIIIVKRRSHGSRILRSTPGVEIRLTLFIILTLTRRRCTLALTPGVTAMSTPVRHFQPNMPYHIYNRGNRKAEVFLIDKDYMRFLKRLKEYKDSYDVKILCYCLMPNHFHFLLKAKDPTSISAFMLRLSTSYAKYFNIKYHFVGRLFQERFRAKLVDTDEYLTHLSRYIHLNPISSDIEDLTHLRSTPGVERGEIRKRLKEYPWSSYHEYLRPKDGICSTETILSYFSKTYPQLSYPAFVEASVPEDATGIIAPFL